MKQILKHTAYIVIAVILLTSCAKEEVQEDMRSAISFNVNSEKYSSRATLFEQSGDLIDKAKGGGDFRLSAYNSHNGVVAISGERVNYINSSWNFRDEKGTPDNEQDDELVKRYWPFNTNLNFFAYMPMNLANTGVSQIGYSAAGGPSFKCVLPLDNSGQEAYQEFMYAYTPEQNSQTNTGVVPLNFVHPFACVKFVMGDSYRITLHQVKLTNIYNEGTFTYLNTPQWSNDGSPKDLVIDVEKRVPEDINNSLIGGPYIVRPQSFADDAAKLVVSLTRIGESKEDKEIPIRQLSEEWEAGKRYTYTISYGNSGEEVIFTVKVDEWDVVEYPNHIEVE